MSLDLVNVQIPEYKFSVILCKYSFELKLIKTYETDLKLSKYDCLEKIRSVVQKL